MYKIKNHRIFNKQLPLFNLLCLFACVYLGIIVNYWYFLFLILIVIMFLKTRINKWQTLFIFIVIACFVPLLILVPKFSFFNYLSKWTRSEFVRNKIFDYFDSKFNKETSSFIKLILFNLKSNETYIIRKQTVNLGIVWLICVGGFHINFLSQIFKLIFKKAWKVGKWIDVAVILTYSYLLNFSYSSLRVLFNLLFSQLINKLEIKRFNKIGTIGLMFCFLNPICFQEYSFLLSFLGATAACAVFSLEIENKIITSLLINLLSSAATVPFVISMNNKISLLTFINTFIFGYIFKILFIYFLIFSWMPFMAIVHKYVIIGTYFIIGNISFMNIYISCSAWSVPIVFAYTSGLYGLSKLTGVLIWKNRL